MDIGGMEELHGEAFWSSPRRADLRAKATASRHLPKAIAPRNDHRNAKSRRHGACGGRTLQEALAKLWLPTQT
jgi:hypothetical protein